MRYFFSFLVVIIYILLNACLNIVWAQRCNTDPIVKDCMSLLAPYNYESYAVKGIVFGSKAKKETIEFTVFDGDSCKLVFCKTELPQELNITIYDKSSKNKNRRIIYFDESGKKDPYVFSFRADKTGNYYIEFEIPPATAPHQQACIVVLIGVKEIKDEETGEE